MEAFLSFAKSHHLGMVSTPFRVEALEETERVDAASLEDLEDLEDMEVLKGILVLTGDWWFGEVFDVILT